MKLIRISWLGRLQCTKTAFKKYTQRKRVAVQAKVTISVRKLAECANCSEEGVNAALDELQPKGFVESDRPKSGAETKADNGGKPPYSYRLHPGKDKYYKKPAIGSP